VSRRLATAGAAIVLAAWPSISQAQGRAGQVQASPPITAKTAAPIDLTGYWVSVVSEDWRYRMVTPANGDYQGVPMTPAARTVADAWDPAADTSAGVQCKSYGAAMIMRVPGRLHITWPDEDTMRVETDAGTQTRTFRFRQADTAPGERSWQGNSTAEWQTPRAARGRVGAAPESPKNGSLKVVTTNVRPGYLRKNGVPHSENATITEYYSLARHRADLDILVVTTIVEDAQYLTQPFVVSSQFKRQAGNAGWDPTPCSSTW
jgi:hypothetical protein